MKAGRHPRRLLVAAILVAVAAAAVVRAAGSSENGGRQAGARATARAVDPAIAVRPDADRRLAVARPVVARKVGRAPRATLILRARDPEGGAPYAVTIKPVTRDRGPTTLRRTICLDVVRSDALHRRRFSAGGCTPTRPDPSHPSPIVHGSTSMLGEATLLRGFAPKGTRRLTVGGIGPTVTVPTGPRGAFVLAVDHDARAILTVTAELADGTTRFERHRVPTGPIPADALEVPDPLDRSTWTVSAGVRGGGHRAGQTCAQFHNLGTDGREAGFGPPMCGDLRRSELFVDAYERRPGRRTKFGGGPHVDPRLIVWGAVGARVAALRISRPDDVSQEVPISEQGRAFIAVLPPAIDRADVSLTVTMRDGTTHELRGPNRVGVAPLTRTRLRRTVALRARVDRPRDRIVLSLGVQGRPDKVKVVFQHHPVMLRRVPGRPGMYAGALRYRRGVPARHRPGRRFRAYSVICAPGCQDRDESGILR